MSAVPADTNAIAFFPGRDAIADGIDSSGDLMTWHSWVLKAGPETFLHQSVAMANAARFHFHTNLSGSRFWNVAFHQFKISARFADLCCFHFHGDNLATRFLRINEATRLIIHMEPELVGNGRADRNPAKMDRGRRSRATGEDDRALPVAD